MAKVKFAFRCRRSLPDQPFEKADLKRYGWRGAFIRLCQQPYRGPITPLIRQWIKRWPTPGRKPPSSSAALARFYRRRKADRWTKKKPSVKKGSTISVDDIEREHRERSMDAWYGPNSSLFDAVSIPYWRI
jgi:hypothetical protein